MTATEGRLVVVEGVEGSHLLEIAQAVVRFLEDAVGQGRVHLTREPTDGPVGRDIRLALQGRLRIAPAALAVMFAADRMDHLTEPQGGILARLARGEWVVSDRYDLSQYAYQTRQGFDLEWLLALNQHARVPDVTFFVDLPLDFCAKSYESERRWQGLHYTVLPLDKAAYEHLRAELEATRAAYLQAIARLQAQREIVVVEGASPTQVIQRIKKILRARLRTWLG